MIPARCCHAIFSLFTSAISAGRCIIDQNIDAAKIHSSCSYYEQKSRFTKAIFHEILSARDADAGYRAAAERRLDDNTYFHPAVCFNTNLMHE